MSKRDAKVCVRIARPGRAGADSTVTTWSSMTGQILALREHLIAQQVTSVVMEATGDYWKPFYYLLEDVERSRLSRQWQSSAGPTGKGLPYGIDPSSLH